MTHQQLLELRQAYLTALSNIECEWRDVRAQVRELVKDGPVRASSGYVYFPPEGSKGGGFHLPDLKPSAAGDRIETAEQGARRANERASVLRYDLAKALWEMYGAKTMMAILDCGVSVFDDRGSNDFPGTVDAPV